MVRTPCPINMSQNIDLFSIMYEVAFSHRVNKRPEVLKSTGTHTERETSSPSLTVKVSTLNPLVHWFGLEQLIGTCPCHCAFATHLYLGEESYL